MQMTLDEAVKTLNDAGYYIFENKINVDPYVYMNLKKEANKIFNEFKKAVNLDIDSEPQPKDHARLYKGQIDNSNNAVSFSYQLEKYMYLTITLYNEYKNDNSELNYFMYDIEIYRPRYKKIDGWDMDKESFIKDIINSYKNIKFEQKHPILTKVGNFLTKER